MVDEVSPEELHDRLERGESVQVVDIRPPASYAQGHIPGAINVPFARLPQEVATVEWGEEIVTVCPLGESSRQAAMLLESYEGVGDDARVANLTGGYEEWPYDLEVEDGATEETPF